MTAPTPPDQREPFTTLQELGVWVKEDPISEENVDFANMVLQATAVVVRYYGSRYWTASTIPQRAKLMADLKAKNFYEHPTGAVSETTGPISERFLDDVVRQLEFTEAEQRLLRELAAEDALPTEGPVEVVGLWALSTTRGPLETHTNRVNVLSVPYWRPHSKGIPFLVEGAFGSPLT